MISQSDEIWNLHPLAFIALSVWIIVGVMWLVRRG